jgi:uncharacterized protein DUF2281
MHDALRARLLRHIEALPEAQVYQALDFVEFLTSKYARDHLRQPGAFQKFTEVLEDKMRGQGLAFGTIKGALGVMGTAGRVVSGITEAGRTVMREVESVMTPRPGDAPPPQLPRAVQQPDGDPQTGSPN